MKPDSPNWIALGDPATPAEAEALDAFRDHLPEDGITTAWANVTFIDDNGRSAEVDVLLLTRSGLYVVELKGWHGTITGTSQRWRHNHRNVENPWLLTDRKAKRLKSLLAEYAPSSAAASQTLPFVNALVVLHGADSKVDLDDRGRTGVYALDGYRVHSKPSLPSFKDFLSTGTTNPHHAIDRQRAKAIRQLCGKAGFKATPKIRMVGDFEVAESTPIAEGPDWQDVVVSLPAAPGVKRRLRLYDIPPKASKSEHQRIQQLAQREFQLTMGVRHDGIDVPLDYKITDDGPALVFEYDESEMPLDAYLADTDDLGLDERIKLIDSLGETLRFAHERHIVHRALSPGRVWVTTDKDGRPSLAIRDWYFGQKDRASDAATRWTTISAGATDLLPLSNQEDWLYLAPEARQSTQELPGIPLDVYGFGALAYLILTGKAPAQSFAELEGVLGQSGSLDPRRAARGIPDGLADVVGLATQTVESQRPETISEVLDLLREAWAEVRRPDVDAEPTSVADPVDAQAGDVISDRFIVASRRGEGSSGVALAVQDFEADAPDREVILKVARSEGAERRLRAEADVLRSLDHKRIVRLLEGPISIDDRSALLMTDAGKETLATRLAKEGRSTIGQLETFGGHLLEAMVHLESKGTFHRDVKPANLGITPDPSTRRPSLVLFDLSLAPEPVENIQSGTMGYLDPYLGHGRRHVYDRAADLYAVSVTLYEMATGQLPWWGEGASGPAGPADPPVIEPTSFEPVLAPQLTQFFKRALSPDRRERHGSAGEMADAWQEIFSTLDVVDDSEESNDAIAAKATPDTPLTQAGLSARALSAVGRLEVVTVGDLLGVHPVRINMIRGLGERYRKEIVARIREWRDRFASEPTAATEGHSLGVERLVDDLLEPLSGADLMVVRAFLGLDPPRATGEVGWPTPGAVAQGLGMTRQRLLGIVDDALGVWTAAGAVALEQLRDEVVTDLARSGRIMTVDEAVTSLVARRGSLRSGEERARLGSALLRAVYELDFRSASRVLELRNRGGSRVDLLALSEQADPDDTGREFPPADLLLESGTELGRRADELVAGGEVVPLSASAAPLRETFTDIAGPLDAPISDARLVRLAAAASDIAALSGLEELYPKDLNPQTAVEFALRGKPGRRISETAIRRSVLTRFPLVKFPQSPAKFDTLVTTVLPGMVNRDGVYEPETARSAPLSSTHLTSFAPTATSEVGRRLDESLRRRGALTLCVPPKRYTKAIAALTSGFPVRALDIGELVVSATKEFAGSHGIEWPFVVGVDAGAKGGADWANLTRLVQQAVTPPLESELAAEQPLLVVNAGPLVRYGMANVLASLLDVGTPRPAARWLLVAMHSDHSTPRLEGAPVPLGPSGWTNLPSDLTQLAATGLSDNHGVTQ